MIEGRCHCGAIGWRLDRRPPYANACNCTACRRYGALWAYGEIDRDVHLRGGTTAYVRADGDGDLAFCFCPTCGNLGWWSGTRPQEDGTPVRAAVNLRLADPDAVTDVPLRRFDGHGTFAAQPDTGQRLCDLFP